MARLQDSRFSLLGIRFGWDAVIGLVPGVGDVAATAMAVLSPNRLDPRVLAARAVNFTHPSRKAIHSARPLVTDH